jgi:hypothetical protein
VTSPAVSSQAQSRLRAFGAFAEIGDRHVFPYGRTQIFMRAPSIL